MRTPEALQRVVDTVTHPEFIATSTAVTISVISAPADQQAQRMATEVPLKPVVAAQQVDIAQVHADYTRVQFTESQASPAKNNLVKETLDWVDGHQEKIAETAVRLGLLGVVYGMSNRTIENAHTRDKVLTKTGRAAVAAYLARQIASMWK